MAHSEDAYPQWLRVAETALIQERRRAAAVPGPENASIGLALSGGGIRSATFGLGLLQGLAAQGMIRKLDYVSTVSGGGYIGAFLGALYTRQPKGTASVASATDRVERYLTAKAPEAFPIRWLRANGRYLAPAGGGNLILWAILLRNWIAVLVCLWVPAVTLFTWGDLLRSLGVHLLPALSAPWNYAGLWWSKAWILSAFFGWTALVSGCAYWVVLPKRAGGTWAPWWTLLFAVVFAAGVTAGFERGGSHALTGIFAAISGTLAISGVRAWVAWTQGDSIGESSGTGGSRLLDKLARVRQGLTLDVKWGLGLAATTLAMALVDTLGLSAYVAITADGGPGAAFGKATAGAVSVFAFIASAGPTLLSVASRLGVKARNAVSLQLIALVAGATLSTVFLVFAATFAHAVDWKGGVPGVALHLDWVALVSVGLLSLTFALSRVRPFLNQSSYAQFYSGRLARTFLGATNLHRWDAAEGRANAVDMFDPTEVVPGDDIPISEHRPHEHGGPLHLINATLNETIDPWSGAPVRDRKGLSFSLGPSSVTVGLDQHARRDHDPRDPNVMTLFPGEELERNDPVVPGESVMRGLKRGTSQVSIFGTRDKKGARSEALGLGQWIGISGAAISPGLGSYTSIGTSLLTVLFNLRLGYWWLSGTETYETDESSRRSPSFADKVGRAFSRSFPVFSHFLDEMSARFHGTARRHWYLTDGGHFENTGCYELIRRKVGFIVFSDAGADPGYESEDLANLVRKARTDFGAEIAFQDSRELDELVDPSLRAAFGMLRALDANGKANMTRNRPACATIAKITYSDGSLGVLLALKPALTGREPHDLLQYADAHENFPNDSTENQFFGEAEWESYRRLGEHISQQVFAAPVQRGDHDWIPRGFEVPSRWRSNLPNQPTAVVGPGDLEPFEQCGGRFLEHEGRTRGHGHA